MHGIHIEYEYSGDEGRWEAAVNTFSDSINNDAELKGKFSYVVTKAKEGNKRFHIGQWDAPETVAHLQSQPYFEAFTKEIKDMAGDTLKPTPISVFKETN